MWRYAYNLKGIYETPVLARHADAAMRSRHVPRSSSSDVRQTGRTILTEYESKQLLEGVRTFRPSRPRLR